MENLLQIRLQHPLHQVQVPQGDIGILKLAFPFLAGHDAFHQAVVRLGSEFLHRAGGGFHGIADHQDHLLLGHRLLPVVLEVGSQLGVSPFIQEFIEEVGGAGGAVVGADEALDLVWQAVFFRYGQTVVHVADDVRGAFQRGFVGVVFLHVRVDGLVLYEAEGVLHLAQVVVEGGGPQQRHVGIRSAAHGVHHIHYLQAVVEGTGGLGAELLQQRVVGVGHFFQARHGHQVEDALKQVYQRVQGHDGHGAHEDLGHREPPHGKVAGVYEAEAHEHGQFYAKHDGGVHKLLPALGEVPEGFYGDGTGREVHHKMLHSVAAEDKERQQAHHVHRQHQALAEESQQVQRKHREGHHIEGRRGHPFQQEGDNGGKEEDAQQIEIAVGIQEDGLVGEEDAEVQHHHQGQGQQDISYVQENARGAVAEHLVVFRLVAVQDLGHFGRYDLPLGDYLLIGPHIAQGGRNEVRGARVGELGHGLVVQEIRDDGLIHAGAAEKGIQVHGRMAEGHRGHQLVPGVGHLVHLGAGVLRGALVLLDVDEVFGHFPFGLVQLHLAVRDHTLGVDVVQARHDGRAQGILLSQVQALDVLDDGRCGLLREAVIRDDHHAGVFPLGLDLLLRLEDGEVELGHQGFVRPGRSFLIVIIEFRGPGHEEHQDCENYYQRYEPFGDLRRRCWHNGRFLR